MGGMEVLCGVDGGGVYRMKKSEDYISRGGRWRGGGSMINQVYITV